MLYEITIDCRIANKEYKKGDLVTIDEVGQYFTTVMKPLRDAPKGEKKPVAIEPVKEDAEEVKGVEEVEDAEEVEEPKKPEPKKASKKKK